MRQHLVRKLNISSKPKILDSDNQPRSTRTKKKKRLFLLSGRLPFRLRKSLKNWNLETVRVEMMVKIIRLRAEVMTLSNTTYEICPAG